MGEHIGAADQIGRAITVDDPPSVFLSQKRRNGRNAGRPCIGAIFLGRLDAEARNAGRDEVLEKIAVIAGDLDDLTVRAQTKRSFAKSNMRARVEASYLNQRSNIHNSRKSHRVEPKRRLGQGNTGRRPSRATGSAAPVRPRSSRMQKAVGERLIAQIDQRAGQCGAAEAAVRGGLGHGRASVRLNASNESDLIERNSPHVGVREARPMPFRDPVESRAGVD